MSTDVPVATITRAVGVTPNTTAALLLTAGITGAASTTFSFSNPDGQVFLMVRNTHASDLGTITISPSATSNGNTVNSLIVTPVPLVGSSSLGFLLVGPFPTSIYTQISGADVGKTTFTCSVPNSHESSLKFWAFRST